jgi:hypothetical protein
MAARKAWSELTPAYRARLERQGITSKNHASANKIRARGHQPSRPVGAAPEELVNKVVRGEALPRDLKTLAKKFTRPSWVPTWATVDVAAALSQLPDPKTWESVEFVPRSDGDAWTMIVHRKGNTYDREILIPGGGGPGSGAKEVLQIVTELEYKQETEIERRRRRAEAIFFEVVGTDEEEA